MNPFKLKNQQNFQVPPLSRKLIRASAFSVRQQLGIENAPRIDFLRFIEMVLETQLKLLEVNILDEAVMGDVEAVTVVRAGDVPMIMVPSEVYDAARKFDPRALFTVCHELGHVFLHAKYGCDFNPAPDNWPAFKSSEWQANEFAAELLAPAHLITPTDNVQSIVNRFGVSEDVARRRIKNFNK